VAQGGQRQAFTCDPTGVVGVGENNTGRGRTVENRLHEAKILSTVWRKAEKGEKANEVPVWGLQLARVVGGRTGFWKTARTVQPTLTHKQN